MGQLKQYYMGLEDEYGDLITKVIQLIDLYPELVHTKLLIKTVSYDLPNLQIEPAAKEAVHKAKCKDALLQEICEVFTEEHSVDFVKVYRWMMDTTDDVNKFTQWHHKEEY